MQYIDTRGECVAVASESVLLHGDGDKKKCNMKSCSSYCCRCHHLFSSPFKCSLHQKFIYIYGSVTVHRHRLHLLYARICTAIDTRLNINDFRCRRNESVVRKTRARVGKCVRESERERAKGR